MASPIAVCFGGPSPEHDISVLTGLQVARVATKRATTSSRSTGRRPARGTAPTATSRPPTSSTARRAAAWSSSWSPAPTAGSSSAARKRRPLPLDCVVVCCHGGPGEGGTLQSALDLAELRYTGPSAAGAALGMDKLATNAVVRALGLPATPQALIDDPAAESLADAAHREAALGRVVARHRGHRRPRHRAPSRRRRRTCAAVPSSSRTSTAGAT